MEASRKLFSVAATSQQSMMLLAQVYEEQGAAGFPKREGGGYFSSYSCVISNKYSPFVSTVQYMIISFGFYLLLLGSI